VEVSRTQWEFARTLHTEGVTEMYWFFVVSNELPTAPQKRPSA